MRGSTSASTSSRLSFPGHTAPGCLPSLLLLPTIESPTVQAQLSLLQSHHFCMTPPQSVPLLLSSPLKMHRTQHAALLAPAQADPQQLAKACSMAAAPQHAIAANNNLTQHCKPHFWDTSAPPAARPAREEAREHIALRISPRVTKSSAASATSPLVNPWGTQHSTSALLRAHAGVHLGPPAALLTPAA